MDYSQYSVVNGRGAGTFCETREEAIEVAQEEFIAFVWGYYTLPAKPDLLYIWFEGILYQIEDYSIIERTAEDQG